MAMHIAPSTVPAIGEFIDVLRALQRGHVLVRASDCAGGCAINGSAVYHSWETLVEHGLIAEFNNPEGFRHVHYYRLSPKGRAFADRAWAEWKSKPLWQRMAARLLH
jgi:DNA-binding IclR family transcriptional regulator